ncbi:32609_t:CDS:2, partial [Gigaspora margarita]
SKLFSKWSEVFASVKHKLLAIRRREGAEKVKRKGIIIDKEVSLKLEFYKIEPSIFKHFLSVGGTGETGIIVSVNSVFHPDICVLLRNCRQPQLAQSTGKLYPILVVEI